MDKQLLITDEEIKDFYDSSSIIDATCHEGFTSTEAREIKDDLRKFADSIIDKVIIFVKLNPDMLIDQHTEQESKQIGQSQ